jgi:hypothetical protein
MAKSMPRVLLKKSATSIESVGFFSTSEVTINKIRGSKSCETHALMIGPQRGNLNRYISPCWSQMLPELSQLTVPHPDFVYALPALGRGNLIDDVAAVAATRAVSSPITIPVHRDPGGIPRLNGQAATGEVAVLFMLEADPKRQLGVSSLIARHEEGQSPGC